MIESHKNQNIYSDVAPYSETAVIINRHLAKTRSKALEMLKRDEKMYINASFIKSPFREGRGDQEPFGLIIAT